MHEPDLLKYHKKKDGLEFSQSFTSYTQSQLSLPDYNSRKYTIGKIVYILITIMNSFFGMYSLFKYQISGMKLIYFYFLSYTFLWPLAIVIGLAFILCIRIYKNYYSDEREEGFFSFFKTLFFRKSLKNKNQTGDLFLNFNTDTESNNFFDHWQYFMIVFIITLVIFYSISVPYSIYILYRLFNNFYKKKIKHLIYVFIFINLLKSTLVFLYFLYFIVIEKFLYNMNKTKKIDLDEEFIRKIEEEIQHANKFSGVISADTKLIKMNNMFNMQEKPMQGVHISNNGEDNNILSFREKSNSREGQDINDFIQKSDRRLSVNKLIALTQKDTIIKDLSTKKKTEKEKKRNIIKETIKRDTMTKDPEEKGSMSLIKEMKAQLSIRRDMAMMAGTVISRSPDIRVKSSVKKKFNFDEIELYQLEGDREEGKMVYQPANTEAEINNRKNSLFDKFFPASGSYRKSKDDSYLLANSGENYYSQKRNSNNKTSNFIIQPMDSNDNSNKVLLPIGEPEGEKRPSQKNIFQLNLININNIKIEDKKIDNDKISEKSEIQSEDEKAVN
jgi:hypothetical protein